MAANGFMNLHRNNTVATWTDCLYNNTEWEMCWNTLDIYYT